MKNENKTDNELIAEFMGGKVFMKTWWPVTSWSKQPYWSFDNGQHFISSEDLPYSSSWDWLMPVVIKCHEIGDAKEKQFPEAKDLDDPTGWKSWSYRRVSLSTDIARVHKNVIIFIEFYNSQRIRL